MKSDMKAVCIREFVKTYDEIEVSEVPKPERKDGEVIVEIAAAGVNFVDLLYARGKHQNNRSLVTPSFTLGLEFAGTVLQGGGKNSKFSPGDRVFGAGIGAFAEQISAKESSLHLIPSHWSFGDAAGLAATAPVSYGALVIRGKLQKGESVLVHAAAGGSGLMAVQIAKAVGAQVIATAGSKERLDVARRFGADECVDYSTGEWWKEVLELTGGHGVDLVYDPVGLVDKSLKCLKHKGRVLVIGFAGTEGMIEKIAMNRVLLKQAQIIGYRFGETERRDPAETAQARNGLHELLENRLLKPTVFDQEYRGLESVVPALKDLAARKVWGKAVILIDPDNKRARL